MYQYGHTVKGAPRLPLNLLDALREFDKDKSLKSALGDDFSAAYLKLKHQEWNAFTANSAYGRPGGATEPPRVRCASSAIASVSDAGERSID